MKIGLLIETSSGGSGKHLADLAAGLTGNGHCVHVLYSPLRSSHEFREALAESGASVASASMKRSIGLSVLKELSHVRSWLRAIGPLDVLHAHSTKAGLLLRALPPRAANARLYSPHAYRSLDVSLPRAARKAAQILEVRLLGGAGIWTIAVGDLEYEHAAAVLGRTLDSGLSEMGRCRDQAEVCWRADHGGPTSDAWFGRGVCSAGPSSLC